MSAVAEFVTGSAVSVLADWEGDVPGDVPVVFERWETVSGGYRGIHQRQDSRVLVVFERWETVRALYALVSSQETIRRAIRRSGAFRVLGGSIEVDSPNVRAWMVDECGRLDVDEVWGLGDGLLLSEWEGAAVRRGVELERLILEVRDDGMLLVRPCEGEGWATIDLTALALAARGR